MLQIFTSKERAKEYARSIPRRKPSSSLAAVQKQAAKPAPGSPQDLTAGVPPDGGYLDLYEHIDFGGCNWRLLEYNSHTVGRAGISLINNLLRQVIILVPLLLVLPRVLGLAGVWLANPISDAAAAVITGAFVAVEVRRLGDRCRASALRRPAQAER